MEEITKKKRQYIRVAGYENRGPYAMRKNGLKELVTSVPPGMILVVPADEWQLDSVRSFASSLNMEVHYTKYSVSVNRMLNKIYIRNNDKAEDSAENVTEEIWLDLTENTAEDSAE